MPESDGTILWRELQAEASERLRRVGVESCDIEARRLVEEAAGFEGPEYASGLNRPATKRGVARFDEMLARRESGEPLQYVLGHWAFRSVDLMVDSRVLIPRPETETVVEVALAEIDRVVPAAGAKVEVVDLGTGSGAIAISIVAERGEVQVWATERSPDAMNVARANIAGAGSVGTRVRLLGGDWFEPLPTALRGCVDVVVSNPPYIGADEDLPAEVRDWEPIAALVSGPTGTEAIEAIIAAAGGWLTRSGALVVELAPHQARAAAELAARFFTEVRVEKDLSGLDRTLVGRRRRAQPS
ncbi:MAG: Release factor glutamine methyltransferase [Acidimicrobiales bacterium]|nr:Release factor glutamine methyltransferase [Acidimicrobiales bacterium]